MAHYGGDVSKAAAAYNWGPGNLDRDIAAHGDAWQQYLPDETSKYVANSNKQMAANANAAGGPNDMGSINTANANTDILRQNAGSLSTRYFTELAGGAIGKAATGISGGVTKFDNSAIGDIGGLLNSMVSAVSGSTCGLSEFTGALSRATGVLNKVGGGSNFGTSASPMRR
jgi:hypothetical protein